MAIKKSKETKAGYIAEYWRVGEFRINRKDNIVYLRMDGYKDSEKRMEDVQAIADFKVYEFTIDGIDENSDLVDFYTYVKGLEEFNGAVDL